jgi:hypothetical protein
MVEVAASKRTHACLSLHTIQTSQHIQADILLRRPVTQQTKKRTHSSCILQPVFSLSMLGWLQYYCMCRPAAMKLL